MPCGADGALDPLTVQVAARRGRGPPPRGGPGGGQRAAPRCPGGLAGHPPRSPSRWLPVAAVALRWRPSDELILALACPHQQRTRGGTRAEGPTEARGGAAREG